jgi:YggT family protein
MSVLAGDETFILAVRTALLYIGAVVAVICAFDWAVRTRRINPFSKSARFFRGRVDPMIAPVERVLVRTGANPAAAPWWAIAAFAIAGVLLISVLQFLGSILTQAMFAAQDPASIPKLLLSWAFSILYLALLVRVLSSWLPISPHSKWIRWSFVLTNWMITPLSRVIPRVGMFDITPIVAYFLLKIIQSVFGIP